MLLVRAPLRISFVGGGTDLPDFYHRSTGRVISATIDKFIYLAIKPTPLLNKFIVKYQSVETVFHPRELSHDRIREALLSLGISQGLEVASFADIPAKTGLGSSSSFSVALMKGLCAYKGKTISKNQAAEAASWLEIDRLKEPIGKQDQYAAAHGGFNIFEFNTDDTVGVEPVLLDFKKRALLESHILLFFTGITRAASSVLGEQKSKIDKNFETYKQMAASVYDFKTKLLMGDILGMANMLHEAWARKKSLASNVSSSTIDTLYQSAIHAGASGGKILGAGGGGCLFLLALPEKHDNIRTRLKEAAKQNSLHDFQEIPVKFTQSGTDILFNSMHQNGTIY